MTTKNEETPKGSDETFDGYSARMKVEFPADRVYASTRDRPAASTYTRKSPGLQEATAQATAAGRLVTYERPLTPDELNELGADPGADFAGLIKEAMSKSPDIIMLGTFEGRP